MKTTRPPYSREKKNKYAVETEWAVVLNVLWSIKWNHKKEKPAGVLTFTLRGTGQRSPITETCPFKRAVVRPT